MDREGLKKIPMWGFFPFEDIHLKTTLVSWWVHSCGALLFLWTREWFHSKVMEWVSGFKTFISGKPLCALEQAVLIFVSVPEQTFPFFCISTVLSPQIQSPCLGWRSKTYFRNRTGTFQRKEPDMRWRCNVEVHTAPALVLICSFAKVSLTGKNRKLQQQTLEK